MICLHDWVTYCGDSLKEILGKFGIGTGQRLDESYPRVGLLVASVETLDSDWHDGGLVLKVQSL